MGVGAGLYMCDVVKKKFTFAISSPDEFLSCYIPDAVPAIQPTASKHCLLIRPIVVQNLVEIDAVV